MSSTKTNKLFTGKFSGKISFKVFRKQLWEMWEGIKKFYLLRPVFHAKVYGVGERQKLSLFPLSLRGTSV